MTESCEVFWVRRSSNGLSNGINRSAGGKTIRIRWLSAVNLNAENQASSTRWLGADVVKTNVTAETVTLNRIQYGPHQNVVRLSQGRQLTLSDDELERDALEPLMQQTGETFRQIDLQRPLEFLKQVTIIDTPGLGDSLKDFSSLVDQA